MPEEMSQNGWRDSGHGRRRRRNENSLMSGPLGLCNNPDCTSCPAAYKTNQTTYTSPLRLVTKLRNVLYGASEGWKRKFVAFVDTYFPIMNPHDKVVQQWNNLVFVSWFVALVIDPSFFFIFSVEKDNKCIVLNWPLATRIAVVRSFTDFIYLLHILLQFRLAYVTTDSRVVGAGYLVDQPMKIAVHYLRGYFLLDLFLVLPVPQVMIFEQNTMGSWSTNYARSLLLIDVSLQYVPRLIRFFASVRTFKSAWIQFVLHLFLFLFAGHITGSVWYLFGLQRVNTCLRDACFQSNVSFCIKFITCGRGGFVDKFQATHYRDDWLAHIDSTKCFDTEDFFDYSIYKQAVTLTTDRSFIARYMYSLFWGFQQISTLAGNLTPSHILMDVVFTMVIIMMGLLLFPLLVGNTKNLLQALGRRQVRQADRYSWAATRGVDEEELLENLPEDLQREMRRHFIKFLKKVRVFTLDEPIINAVIEKLRPQFYISGSDILYQGGPIEKIVFIVRGEVESIGADGHTDTLSEGDVCGEELLTWYLEHSSVHKDVATVRFPGNRLFSTRTIKCLTNVEAFVLRAADLEEVAILFARFQRNPRVHGAIRYESPNWENMDDIRIQVDGGH